jgi:hypothetical protein
MAVQTRNLYQALMDKDNNPTNIGKDGNKVDTVDEEKNGTMTHRNAKGTQGRGSTNYGRGQGGHQLTGRGGRHHQGRGQGPSLTVTADDSAGTMTIDPIVEMPDAVMIDDTATKGRGNRPTMKGQDKEEEDEEATDSFLDGTSMIRGTTPADIFSICLCLPVRTPCL